MSRRHAPVQTEPPAIARRLADVLWVGQTDTEGKRQKKESCNYDPLPNVSLRGESEANEITDIRLDTVPTSWSNLSYCYRQQLKSVRNASSVCANPKSTPDDIPDWYIEETMSEEGLYWLVTGMRRREESRRVLGYAVCKRITYESAGALYLSLICSNSRYAKGKGMQLFRNVLSWALHNPEFSHFVFRPVNDDIAMNLYEPTIKATISSATGVPEDGVLVDSTPYGEQEHWTMSVNLNVARGTGPSGRSRRTQRPPQRGVRGEIDAH